MTKKHAVTNNVGGTGRALALGSAVSILTTLGLCAFVALLVDKQTLSYEMLKKLPLILTGVSCLVGTWIAGGLAKKQQMVVCLLSGMVYLLVLFSVTAFAFQGGYHGIAASSGVILGCSTLTGLLHAKGGKRTKKAYYKFK